MADKPPVPLPPVSETVTEMDPPSSLFRKDAAQGRANLKRHERLRNESSCLNTIRVVQPQDDIQPHQSIKVVSWNLERCKFVEDAAKLLDTCGAHICLLTEMDLGMARSSNRDTTADLAGKLGMGHAFGVEFIELGKGDIREQAEHAETDNLHGLHGNAVLTRFPISQAALLPLDNDGFWYTDKANADQRRIGGRIAIAVRHLSPNPFWVVSVHFESRLGPEERAAEASVLLNHIDLLCGEDPVLIGGDFNCKAVQEAQLTAEEILSTPQQVEPMFSEMSDVGFSWQSCNTADVTTRNHSWTAVEHRPLKKIDWLFARGLTCSAPAVLPAVNSQGQNLSDHEAISVTISF